ncbi:MspA family porin [Nocardia sp. KC 131]|uniref:MspA family porin n=1 Tax=Nocardia arseniciresistens TaxID=3392119 RepID=UPI00398EAA85
MNRKHSHTLATITAVILTTTGAVAAVDTAANAAPGEVSSAGLHLIASADASNVVGSDVALDVPFAHGARVSGNFSMVSDGPSSMRRGKIAAGYLIGCAVDVSDGISVSMGALEGASTGVTPGIAVTLVPEDGVGAVVVGVDASLSGTGGLTQEITTFLAPGSVTAVVIAEAELDQESTFPFTFAHTNTPLNVNGCLSPASAMSFITVRADATNGIAQTTGYGAKFVF